MKGTFVKVVKGAVAVLAAGAAVAAHAAGTAPDLTGMTSAIDWTTTIAALLVVAGGLAGVYVVLTATNIVSHKIKRG